MNCPAKNLFRSLQIRRITGDLAAASVRSRMKWKGKEEAPEKPGKRPGGESVAGYVAEQKWTEPFSTAKPQTLRLEIHTWSVEKHKHNCVFICASSQPDTAEVWKSMREIRSGLTLK